MKNFTKLVVLAAMSYGAFTIGRVYEVGRIVVKGFKFLSSIDVLEEKKEEKPPEHEKVTIKLSKEDYCTFRSLYPYCNLEVVE